MSGGGGGEMMRWGWAGGLSPLLRRPGGDRRLSALERAPDTAPANAEAAPADSWGLKGDSGLPGEDPERELSPSSGGGSCGPAVCASPFGDASGGPAMVCLLLVVRTKRLLRDGSRAAAAPADEAADVADALMPAMDGGLIAASAPASRGSRPADGCRSAPCSDPPWSGGFDPPDPPWKWSAIPAMPSLAAEEGGLSPLAAASVGVCWAAVNCGTSSAGNDRCAAANGDAATVDVSATAGATAAGVATAPDASPVAFDIGPLLSGGIQATGSGVMPPECCFGAAMSASALI
mmetsp:Transcript_3546/g.10301  ORF Transcript_3546/g.10301 Transcript_3546/m.10301 type:complete len:291 (-) Transcript_3546:2715-3587(-)